MVIGCSKTIFGDMQVTDPEFRFEKNAEAVRKTYFSFSDRFDFRSGKHHTRIVFFFDEIFMISRSVSEFSHNRRQN
jgi:hypothetical protein